MTTSFSRVVSVAMGAALAVGAVLAAVPADAAPADANLVPDANLRACLTDEMHYHGLETTVQADSITQADLDALAAAGTATYDLNCTGRDISSLEGLQYLHDPKLTSLEINWGEITDLTPLGGLTGLVSLNITNNSVKSLSGLETLTNLGGLTITDTGYPLPQHKNQISDITPLSGLTNLQYINLSYNHISSLVGLEGLSNLTELYFAGNQINDLTPLRALTNMQYLNMSFNQISTVEPLAGLTQLQSLWLDNNQISNVAPLTGLTKLWGLRLNNNEIKDISSITNILNATRSAGETIPGVQWTLTGNHITDVSSLDWNIVGQVWLTVPSEYQDGVYNEAVTGQTIDSQTAVVGTTLPLPEVKQAAHDPYPLTWKVVSGDASINSNGSVTYNAVGPVLLSWSDNMTVDYRTAYDCTTDANGYVTCAPSLQQRDPINLSFFSGTVSVNVSDGGTSPVPSVPESEVAKDKVVASTTGGAARIADGSDTYTLITTVKDENGVALNGYVNHLSASSAPQVSLSVFTPNGDGTYSLVVKSTTPGNYVVTVLLDGTTIQTIPVNFIAADISQPTRMAGQAQSATGLGFLPGEKVNVTLHSDPIALGVSTADANGTVTVDFTLPADFAVGRHTVEFVGEQSGMVAVGFDVVSPAKAETGGSSILVSSSTPVLVLVFSVLAAAGFSIVMGLRKRTR